MVQYSKYSNDKSYYLAFFIIKLNCIYFREILQTEKSLLSLIASEKIKEGGSSITYNYLLPNWMRSNLLKIKQEVESDIPGSKLMIYDPTHPRKNITLSISANQYLIERTRNSTINKIKNIDVSELKFDKFQEQISFQMTKYLFKYLQNSFLAEDVVFMKNWDVLSTDYRTENNNFDSEHDSISRDYELILYIAFVRQLKCKDLYEKFHIAGKDEILKLIKTLIYKVINNNISLTKIFKSVFEKDKIEAFLKNFDTKYLHNSDLIRAFQDVKCNPKAFLSNPEAFINKILNKHSYNEQTYKDRDRHHSIRMENNITNNNNERDEMKEEPIKERLKQEKEKVEIKKSNSPPLIVKESAKPPPEKIIELPEKIDFFNMKTHHLFNSALNEQKSNAQRNPEKKELFKIKDQIEEDNKDFDEKKNNVNNKVIEPPVEVKEKTPPRIEVEKENTENKENVHKSESKNKKSHNRKKNKSRSRSRSSSERSRRHSRNKKKNYHTHVIKKKKQQSANRV